MNAKQKGKEFGFPILASVIGQEVGGMGSIQTHRNFLHLCSAGKIIPLGPSQLSCVLDTNQKPTKGYLRMVETVQRLQAVVKMCPSLTHQATRESGSESLCLKLESIQI